MPPSQIIDTVNIYHLPARQRKLSLRFLAYVVLKEDIQSKGTHDSIEDARTALQLYEQYQRMDVQGEWEDELEEIYREGKRLVSTSLTHKFFTDSTVFQGLEGPWISSNRLHSCLTSWQITSASTSSRREFSSDGCGVSSVASRQQMSMMHLLGRCVGCMGRSLDV